MQRVKVCLAKNCLDANIDKLCSEEKELRSEAIVEGIGQPGDVCSIESSDENAAIWANDANIFVLKYVTFCLCM